MKLGFYGHISGLTVFVNIQEHKSERNFVSLQAEFPATVGTMSCKLLHKLAELAYTYFTGKRTTNNIYLTHGKVTVGTGTKIFTSPNVTLIFQ